MAGTSAQLYETLQATGSCVQCRKRPAADGASLCERHLLAQRRRDARWKRLQRQTRRAAGLCAFCPLVSERYRCSACEAKQGRRRVSGVQSGVDKQARIGARTILHPDGRTRYHGQHRRGQQTREQLDGQDRVSALRQVDAGFTRLALYRSPEVQALPRIQRESVKRQALQEIDHGTRFLDEVLERNGHFRDETEMVRMPPKRKVTR